MPYVAGKGGFLFVKKRRSSCSTDIHSHSHPAHTALFGGPRVLCAAALLAALSIVLGKFLAISTPLFRLSFENLPILMAGIFFGPVIGAAVGAVADLVGCLLVGYAINPIITLGGMTVGVISGCVTLIATRRGRSLRPLAVCIAVVLSHTVGSVLIKTWGLKVFWDATTATLLFRIPLYVVISVAESAVLVILTRSRTFMDTMHRLLYRKKGGR